MHDLAAAAGFQAGPLLQEEQQPLRCPRCDSTNTKFCYYNNYNLSQPRHFCRDCRRYWTRGGALRNVPVGGGTRNRKSSKRAAPSSSSSSSSSSTSPSKRSKTAAPPATPSAPPLQIPTIEHAPLLRPTHGGVLIPPRATDLGLPIGISGHLSAELHILGGSGDNMVAPPPTRTPVPETVLRLQGDSNCRSGGGGWPDLSIYTPGSKSQ